MTKINTINLSQNILLRVKRALAGEPNNAKSRKVKCKRVVYYKGYGD